MEYKALKKYTFAWSRLTRLHQHRNDGQVALELRSALFLSFLGTRWAFGMTMVALPCHIVNKPRLQEQVSLGQQVVTDQILVGSHCDPIAETEGTQHVQNLQQDTRRQTLGPLGGHSRRDLMAST